MAKWMHLYPAMRRRLLDKLSATTDPDECLRLARLLVMVERHNHARTPHDCKAKKKKE